MEIYFSNTKMHDKTFEQFLDNPLNKLAGGSKSNHSDKEYLAILNRIIPHRIEITGFKDVPLQPEEIQKVKDVFEEEVEKLLVGRQPLRKGSTGTIEIKGKEIKIDIRPNGINDYDYKMYNFYRVYKIADECWRENKPMYLSIYEE